MDEILLQLVDQRLRTAQRVLIVTHLRPDGDAIGSLLGLGLSLQVIGKQVQMVCSDRVPMNFRHLAGSELVTQKPEGAFDLIVVVDCSDFSRVGSSLEGYPSPDLNVDHHPTNMEFASLNWIEAEAVATAEMLAVYLKKFAFPMTQPVAAALLYGMISDSLGFRTNNMTPQALRVAADLMEAGADLPTLYHHGLVKRSFEAARYWGAALSGLQRDGRMIWTTLTMAERRAVGYPGRDDADLINVLSALDGADVVLLFVEQNNGQVKVSWRSQLGFDVSQVALRFGGGGHKAASGAEVNGNLDEVQNKVLSETRLLFNPK